MLCIYLLVKLFLLAIYLLLFLLTNMYHIMVIKNYIKNFKFVNNFISKNIY